MTHLKTRRHRDLPRKTDAVSDRVSDVPNHEVSWNVLVHPDSDGGFGWEVWTDHPLWLPQEVKGRASSEAEANAVARVLAARCTEVARMFMEGTGVRDVRFALMTVFPDEPVGGGFAVGRLSQVATVNDGQDRWTELEDRAVDWQTRGGRQTFVAMDSGDEESGWRLRELFGCMGALGEQVMLACAAARDLSTVVGSPDSARAELVRRAWAEHVIHWTMAAGHMFQNVVGRSVALDPAVRAHLLGRGDADGVPGDSRRKHLGTVFPQESDANDDWPTFNKRNANHLRLAAAKSDVAEVIALGGLIHQIAVNQQWRTMTALRGQAFHRWRAQTAGVSTMQRRMTRIVGDDGLLPGGALPDVRGPDGSKKAVDSAECALVLLGDALAQFDGLLPAVLRSLTTTVMHEDGLLSSYGPVSLIESSRGTGAIMLSLKPERQST